MHARTPLPACRHVHTLYAQTAVQRAVGGYACTARNKNGTLEQAGCLPLSYSRGWGFGIQGPAYAGMGPPTRLVGLSSPREPGLGRTMPITATLTISNLEVGRRYELYTITSLAGVPASAAAAIDASAWPPTTFVADAAQHSVTVTFQSAKPAYYICKLAAGG